MAHWVLLCPQCKTDFNHSEVKVENLLSDAFSWLGAKPEFPAERLKLECPNCKTSSLYAWRSLRYSSF
jgi:phage FluMu protein Com